ncbi:MULTISPECIES: dihydropteroate synthase [Nitrincola]|uniref:Dihydropteroate synthase n=1 Tax=Nitrincola nitratireducens TaxID=1229521 RepID=W9UZF2_9GAMM|nr:MULTISPECIES: dihydropteroate synthase [Nitrincola]EXJ09277.1 Dihydropteroate synthase [Nitrincola nitratireducens]
MKSIQCGTKRLALDEPKVMGILNVTPDSFSDGGRYYRDDCLSLDAVLRQAREMVMNGAQILDVGGESTRPGAAEVSVQQELDRIAPVVERLVSEFDVVVSVDTSQPVVMSVAASLGAGLINDVRALRVEGALEAVVKAKLPVCLMHMQGAPATMQEKPEYQNVMDDVSHSLLKYARRCEEAGVAKDQIILDPGFGFGKSLAHNLQLLNRLDEICELGYPVLSGTSRKSMVGAITGKEPQQRLGGSLCSAILAVQKGACIVRVHDVAETVDALKLMKAVRREAWEV